ncbi:ATP-binding domain-containing protein, partial [candidate division WWE3 bacterium]|nr:ATP-binding domain-containing protein [candidate division WWE3 bacterium]
PEVASSSRNKVSTIHGLIYTPIEDSRGSIAGWKLKESIDADLVIVDEGSMVSGDIWQDLLSFGIPILVVGDHGQLPPIKGSFNLMEKPDLILNEIHRQAKDNPIIKVSIMARETGLIPAREYGDAVIKFDVAESDTHMVREDMLSNYTTDTLIICGYNKTRTMINQYIRSTLDFESPEPQAGDRVICLRNNHEKGIYNGMLGTVEFIKSASEDWYEAEIKMDDVNELYFGKLYKPQFNAPEAINFTKDRLKATGGDLFDFGYALTVHKAQGSQAKKVILFEERFSKMDDIEWRKWLYTAVTRAEEELYIFGR